MADTVFWTSLTLALVAAGALALLAGPIARAFDEPAVAPLLMAMYARYWVDKLAGMPVLRSAAEVLLYSVPLAAGIVLLALATRDWRTVNAQPQPA